MEPDTSERSARYRRMEPPIRLDETVESVDVATPPVGADDAYRDQEWLIRHASG